MQFEYWRSPGSLRLRATVTWLLIFTFLGAQVCPPGSAGVLDPVQQTHYKTSDELEQEGFIGEDYAEQLQGRENYQKHKMAELDELRKFFEPNNKQTLKNAADSMKTVQDIQAVNQIQNQQTYQDVRASGERQTSLVASFSQFFIKYGDGKKVWMFGGLVTDVENEVSFDKHGNRSIRNTHGMTYNQEKQMLSYTSDTTDAHGNKTGVVWKNGKYWSEADEAADLRKKAGTLASFTEIRTDEIGVSTTTEWSEIGYYTDADQSQNDKHQHKQMASYTKTEVSSATPERVDTFVTSDIEYLKREKLIEDLSEDPKEAERRKSREDKFETLMTGFHEERNTFDVKTGRDWRNARYNAYSELEYYEETSRTYGVTTGKVFENALYDDFGRLIAFAENSKTHGTNTKKERLKTEYNDQNQILSYEERIREYDLETRIQMKIKKYNENGQIQEYVELMENSEEFKRETHRHDMKYDLRGLLTHFIDEYDEEGLHHTIERETKYNKNGLAESWIETHREQGSYAAPDGSTVNIDRITLTERLSTDYANGLERAFHEKITDPIGLVTDVFRRNIAYDGNKVVYYDETREVRGKLSQNTLQLAPDGWQFLKTGLDYDLGTEDIEVFYTLEKKFYGARYSNGKLVEYSEDTVDSRQGKVSVTTHRYDQKYANGKVVSYSEDQTTQASNGNNSIHKEWQGVFQNNHLMSYSELSRTLLGLETLTLWQADLYNPIGLIQAFTETVTQGGHSVTKQRSNVHYNELDQMLKYEELQKDLSTGRETHKLWETTGYNGAGFLKDYKETTIKGTLTSVLQRRYLVYNSLGNLRQFVQDLMENGSYTNSSGIVVNINRSSLLERLETLYDSDGREQEYKEFSTDPAGVETRTRRYDITYLQDGNVNTFTEEQDIRASFTEDQITGAVPPTVVAGGNGVNLYNYQIIRQRLSSTVGPTGQLQDYSEIITDSRKPDLEVQVDRQNQQYLPGGQLSHYEETRTESTPADSFAFVTLWDGQYSPLGLLLSSTENVTDYLGMTRVNLFQALSWNAVDLAESSLETSYIEDGADRIAESRREKSDIQYNGLDQRVAYSEEQRNRDDDVLSTSLWTGSYYDGSDLLRAQRTETSEGTLLRVSDETGRVYNANGILEDSLVHLTETSALANDYVPGENPAFESDHGDALALNPADMSSGGGSLLQNTLADDYRVESFVRHSTTSFNTLGQEENYTETRYSMDGVTVIGSTQTDRTINDQMIDGRLSHYIDNTTISYTTSTGTVSYQTTRDYLVNSWNPLRGLPESTFEVLTDTRRSDGVGASLWSQELTRSNILYDDENRLFSYLDETEEQSSDSLLDTRTETERQSTGYTLSGLESAFTEIRREQFLGADTGAGEVTVETERDWTGSYNGNHLLQSSTETATNPPGSLATTTQVRDVILYDRLGREVLTHDSNTGADGVARTISRFNTGYDGSSRRLLETTSISRTNGLDIAEIIQRTNVTFDNATEFITEFSEIKRDYGTYYTTNFGGVRGVLGVSLSPIATTLRSGITRNTKGQTNGYQDILTDAFNVVTTDIRSAIQYSLRGQEIHSFSSAETVGQISGVDALSFTLTRDLTTQTFTAQGLPLETLEIMTDTRRSDLQSTTVKTNAYDALNVLRGFTQTLTELDTANAPPLYNLVTTTTRSLITYDSAGRTTGYTDTLDQNTALIKELLSAVWSQGSAATKTLTLTFSFLTGTTLLATSTEQTAVTDPTLGLDLVTTLVKDNIQYDSLNQETAYRNTATDPSGYNVVTNTTGLIYNTLNQLLSSEDSSLIQGTQTDKRREDIVYDLNGRVVSYQDIKHEQNTTVGIDRVTLLDRLAQTYNPFGQLTGFVETAYTPFGISELSTMAPLFPGGNILDLESTHLKPNTLRTQTTRTATIYTLQNQLAYYWEDLTTFGDIPQNTLTLADAYDAGGPLAQTTTGTETISVLINNTRLYLVREYDTLGREISTEHGEIQYIPPSTFTTAFVNRTDRTNIAYDSNGRQYSYTEESRTIDAILPPILLNKHTLITRQSTLYTASGQVSSLTEQINDFGPDGTTLHSVTNRDFDAYYHPGTDQISKTVEITTLFESDPLGIQGFETTTLRDGLMDSSGVPGGILYNERGFELAYSELRYPQNGALSSAPVLTRRIDQQYNELGKPIGYIQETGQLTTGFDDSLDSAYVDTAPGVWALNGDYTLTEQTLWEQGQYDTEGRLTGYHETKAPLGLDIPGLSDTALQSASLYEAPEHTYFLNATYNNLGRLLTSTQTHWTFLDDPLDAINLREDIRNDNFIYDPLGRALSSTETKRTRQGATDYFQRTDSAQTYTGLRQTSMNQTIFTESATNASPGPALPDTDPNAYSSLVTRRVFTNMTYDALFRQASYSYTENEGSHLPASPFIFIPGATSKDQYDRATVAYDSRGRLDSYTDTYSYKDFLPTTGGTSLVIERLDTRYHDNETITTTNGFPVEDDSKSKMKYYSERVLTGGIPKDREFSLEYLEKTGLLSAQHEYVNEWKLQNFAIDANGRYTNYTGIKKVPNGSGGEDLFQFDKTSITYASNVPSDPLFFTETGFAGSIGKDENYEGSFDLTFTGLNIDQMSFDSGILQSYHEFYRDDLTAAAPDVEITKTEITETGYKATIVKGGQTFYVSRELLSDDTDGSADPTVYHRVRDTYYSDATYATETTPPVIRTYYFDTDESGTPPVRLVKMMELVNATDTITYTAQWIGTDIDGFQIDGATSGGGSFSLQNVKYYPWWSPYSGQIRAFDIADALNTRVDQISYDMGVSPPEMTGYRIRQDGQPDRVYSQLTNPAGFTLSANGETYSAIQTATLFGQTRVTAYTHGSDVYSNLTYNAGGTLTQFDWSNGSTTLTNVTLSGGLVTGYNTTETGTPVQYSSITWQSGQITSFTKTIPSTGDVYSAQNYTPLEAYPGELKQVVLTNGGTTTTYDYTSYSGGNLTGLSVTSGGTTTDYTFGSYASGRYTAFTQTLGGVTTSIRSIQYDGSGNVTRYEQLTPDTSTFFDPSVQRYQIIERIGGVLTNIGVKLEFDYNFDSTGSAAVDTQTAKYEIITQDGLGRPTEYWVSGIDYTDYTTALPASDYPRLIQMRFTNVTYDASNRVTGYDVETWKKSSATDMNIDGSYPVELVDNAYTLDNITYDASDRPISYDMQDWTGTWHPFNNAAYDASGTLLSYDKDWSAAWSVGGAWDLDPSGNAVNWTYNGQAYQNAVYDSYGGLDNYDILLGGWFPWNQTVNTADRYKDQNIGNRPEFNINQILLPFDIASTHNTAVTPVNPAISTLGTLAANASSQTAADNLATDLTEINTPTLLEPLTSLPITSRVEALSRYTHIEKEILLHDMVTFSAKEVITTEYLYDSYGKVKAILTHTKDQTGKTLETSERRDIVTDRLGRTISFVETQTDRFGVEKIIRRLDTVFDDRGNVISFTQITETKKTLTNSDSVTPAPSVIASDEGARQSSSEQPSPLPEQKPEQVLESLETQTEIVSGQQYNDKRQLLKYQKKTDLEKTGATEEGRRIRYRENTQTKIENRYDAPGSRLSYTQEQTQNSLTPLLTTTTTRDQIAYDDRGREQTFSLTVNEQGKDLTGALLLDNTQTLTRVETSFDAFDRARGYTEERHSSQASQLQTLTRSGIGYGQGDRLSGFTEKTTTENSTYETLLIRQNITRNLYGQEMTWRQMFSEKDPAIGAEKTIVTERRNSTLDAFGNMTHFLERTLALAPNSGFGASQFLAGGVLPSGALSQIVFTGGSYDDTGRYIGFRQTTATAYGEINYGGAFGGLSIVERVSQTQNDLGQITGTEEKYWDAQRPDLLTQNTSTFTFNTLGQKSGETKTEITTGNFAIPGQTDLQTYFSKTVTTTENISYDPASGWKNGSLQTREKYGPQGLELTEKISEQVRRFTAGGHVAELKRSAETRLADLSSSFTEETETTYTYDSNFNISTETTDSKIFDTSVIASEARQSSNIPPLSHTHTFTQNTWNPEGRLASQTTTSEDLLRTQGRQAENQNPLQTITHKQMDYTSDGQISDLLTQTLEVDKTTQVIRNGTLTLENNIQYTGAGTRASYTSATFKVTPGSPFVPLSINTLENSGPLAPGISPEGRWSDQAGTVPGAQPSESAGAEPNEEKPRGGFSSVPSGEIPGARGPTSLASPMLPVPAFPAMLSISLGEISKALQDGKINQFQILPQQLTLKTEDPAVLALIATLGMSPESLTLTHTQNTSHSTFGTDGQPTGETTTGVRYLPAEPFPTAVAYTETKTNITRDPLGRLLTENTHSTQTGQPDTDTQLRSRSYDAAGRVIGETTAVPTGKDSSGQLAYTITELKNVTFDTNGNRSTFDSTRNTPDGNQQNTHRLKSEFDDSGRLLFNAQTTDSVDQNGKTLQTRYSETLVGGFDTQDRIISQRTTSGVVDGPINDLEHATEQIRPKTYTDTTETYTYDRFSRITATHSEITDGFRSKTTSDHAITAFDDKGRALDETLTTTKDNKTTNSHTTNIAYNSLNQRTSYEDLTTETTHSSSPSKISGTGEAGDPSEGRWSDQAGTVPEAKPTESAGAESSADQPRRGWSNVPSEGSPASPVPTTKTFHSVTFEIAYNASGQRESSKRQDLPDSYQANPNVISTSQTTYDAVGRQTGSTTSGMDRDGKSFSERKSGMNYNADNELTGYSVTGMNNGDSYSYTRSNITYYSKQNLTGQAETGSRSLATEGSPEGVRPGMAEQIASYTETGVTSEGSKYNESHDTLVYDSENRVTSEHVSGKRSGKKFDEDRKSSYIAEGVNAGRLASSESKSRNSKDYSKTSGYLYDLNGNATSYHSESQSGKTKTVIDIKQTFANIGGKFWKATTHREDGAINGKSYHMKQTNMAYNSQGQLTRYEEKGKQDGENYYKNVSSIKYNALGQKTSQTFRDTRNESFKSSDSKTLVEEYSYGKDGELKESKLKTPDYIATFTPDGKQKGQIKETASFQAYKANEIKKAQRAAEKSARKKAEAALMNGPAGYEGYVDAATGEPVPGTGGQSYGSPQMNGLMGAGMFSVVDIRNYRGGVMPNQGGPQSMLVSSVLGTVPAAQQADLKSLIARELSKIRITQPKIDEKAINQAISNAVKTLYPNKKQALKVLALTKAKVGEAFKMNLLKGGTPAQAGAQDLQLAFGTRAVVDPAALSKNKGVIPAQAGIQSPELFNEFGFAIPAMPSDQKLVWVKYDDKGKLASKTEFTTDLSADGTQHTRAVTETFKNGYLESTSIKETFNGPNVNLTVDTTISKDGSSTSHIYGSEKDEATGQMKAVDETRKSKTIAISGGFKTVTDIVDNISGLTSKKTDTYTGVKYAGGQMVEFNLKSTHTGQIKNWNPQTNSYQTQDIHKESTVKQYASKLDGEGRLVSYKTDLWDNGSPDKRTTQQTDVLAFDSQNRNFETVTQTWEKGSSVDGVGNKVNLDSYSVAHRSDIQYNSNNQAVSYSEKTYTQEPLKSGPLGPGAPPAGTLAPPRRGGSALDSAPSLSEGSASGTVPARSLQRPFGETPGSQSPTTLTLGSSTYSATSGYQFKSSDTSRSGISYDYAGRTSFYKDSSGKAHHTNYNTMDMVVASKDAGVITRHVAYSQNGNQIYKESKDTTGEQSVNGQHWQEFNSLGQVTKSTDILRSDGAAYSMTKHTEQTLSYGVQGETIKLHENVLKDSMDSHFTVGQIITTVVAVVAAVATAGASLGVMGAWIGASAMNAAVTVAAGAFTGALADGKGFGEALKAGAITFATAYAGAQLGAGLGDTFASNVANGTLAEALTSGAQYFGAQTLVNTAINMAQGMDAAQAFKMGAASALVTVAAVGMGGNLKAEPGTSLSFSQASTGLGKEFLKGYVTGYAQSVVTGASGSEAGDTALAGGLGAVMAGAIGLGLQSAGIGGLTPQGVQAQGSSFESHLSQQIISNAVSKVQQAAFQVFANQMGDKEAQFLSQIAGNLVQAGLKNLQEQQSGQPSTEDKNSPFYLPGLAQGLAQTTLQATLVAIADKVTKEGSYGEEFALAFAASTAQNFNLNVFTDSIKEIRADNALKEGRAYETTLSDGTRMEIGEDHTRTHFGKDGASYQKTLLDEDGKERLYQTYDKADDTRITFLENDTAIVSTQDGTFQQAFDSDGKLINGFVGGQSLDLSAGAATLQYDPKTGMVTVFRTDGKFLESFLAPASLVRDSRGKLLSSTVRDDKGNATYYNAQGQVTGGARVLPDGSVVTLNAEGKAAAGYKIIDSPKGPVEQMTLFGMGPNGRDIVLTGPSQFLLYNGLQAVGVVNNPEGFVKETSPGTYLFDLSQPLEEFDLAGNKTFTVNGDQYRYGDKLVVSFNDVLSPTNRHYQNAVAVVGKDGKTTHYQLLLSPEQMQTLKDKYGASTGTLEVPVYDSEGRPLGKRTVADYSGAPENPVQVFDTLAAKVGESRPGYALRVLHTDQGDIFIGSEQKPALFPGLSESLQAAFSKDKDLTYRSLLANGETFEIKPQGFSTLIKTDDKGVLFAGSERAMFGSSDRNIQVGPYEIESRVFVEKAKLESASRDFSGNLTLSLSGNDFASVQDSVRKEISSQFNNQKIDSAKLDELFGTGKTTLDGKTITLKIPYKAPEIAFDKDKQQVLVRIFSPIEVEQNNAQLKEQFKKLNLPELYNLRTDQNLDYLLSNKILLSADEQGQFLAFQSPQGQITLDRSKDGRLLLDDKLSNQPLFQQLLNEAVYNPALSKAFDLPLVSIDFLNDIQSLSKSKDWIKAGGEQVERSVNQLLGLFKDYDLTPASMQYNLKNNTLTIDVQQGQTAGGSALVASEKPLPSFSLSKIDSLFQGNRYGELQEYLSQGSVDAVERTLFGADAPERLAEFKSKLIAKEQFVKVGQELSGVTHYEADGKIYNALTGSQGFDVIEWTDGSVRVLKDSYYFNENVLVPGMNDKSSKKENATFYSPYVDQTRYAMAYRELNDSPSLTQKDQLSLSKDSIAAGTLTLYLTENKNLKIPLDQAVMMSTYAPIIDTMQDRAKFTAAKDLSLFVPVFGSVVDFSTSKGANLVDFQYSDIDQVSSLYSKLGKMLDKEFTKTLGKPFYDKLKEVLGDEIAKDTDILKEKGIGSLTKTLDTVGKAGQMFLLSEPKSQIFVMNSNWGKAIQFESMSEASVSPALLANPTTADQFWDYATKPGLEQHVANEYNEVYAAVKDVKDQAWQLLKDLYQSDVEQAANAVTTVETWLNEKKNQ